MILRSVLLYLFVATTFLSQNILIADDGNIFNHMNNGSVDTNPDGSITVDQERTAETYIHDGLAQKRLQDICNGKNKDSKTKSSNDYGDICSNADSMFDGSDKGNNGWKLLESMVPFVTKAYSAIGVTTMTGMLGGKGGGKDNPMDISFVEKENGKPVMSADNIEYKANSDGKYVNPETKEVLDAPPEGAKKKKTKKTDYCAIIPGAVDTTATLMHQAKSNQIQEGVSNTEGQAKQAETFYALAQSHESLEKTSTIQAAGWGATSACYVGYGVAGGFADPKLWVKMALASGVTYFYARKAKEHKKRAKLLKQLGDSFPKAGECNPVTDTMCFCSEESSLGDMENFQKYCSPKQFKFQTNNPEDYVSCIDEKGKPDPECKCKKRRSCINAALSPMAFKLGLNPSMMKGASQALKPFGDGFGASSLEPGIERSQAMARKAFKRYRPKGKLPTLRDATSKNIEKTLIDAGVPRALARLSASKVSGISGNSSAFPRVAARGFGDRDLMNKNDIPKKMKKSRFKRGARSSTRRKGRSTNPFAKRRTASRGGVKIQDYSGLADRATSEADITRDSGKGLFDILSHRYKMRAWRELESPLSEGAQ